MPRGRFRPSIASLLTGTALLLTATTAPAAVGAAMASAAPAGAAAGAAGRIRSAAELAGAGASQAGCAGATQPGFAHCYLADEPAPAPALSSTCTVDEQDGYSPCNLREAYKLGSLIGTHGRGQTVAIVDAYDDPDAESDLATFRHQFGISPCTTANGCFEKLNEEGDQGNYPSGDMGWGLEISTDLDMVSTICPRCHIVLVEADSSSFSDLFAAEAEAVSLGVHVVNNSWGSGEFSGETSDDSSFNVPGIAFTASSGDGAYQGGVQYPSASRYVTSVGGTELTPDKNKRGWIEKPWVTPGSPPTQGSSSGCSAYESKPSWQKDSGCSRRTTADVSAVATDVLGYDTYESGGGGWYFLYGTSVAAAIIAGVYGLAGNAAAQHKPPAALAYAHHRSLYDISGGLATGTCSPSYLCNAIKGYDGPTGLGTPRGIGAF
jgi:subtilase family serine protease